MTTRNFTWMDRALMTADQALRSMTGGNMAEGTGRPSPAEKVEEQPMTVEQRALSVGLMRVNHAGEIAAQGLYHGQALVAREDALKQSLQQAAAEENDHLCWCKQRLEDLNGDISALTPLWYLGSVGVGVVAGLAGDRWSLGFIAETEHQVMDHLDGHLQRLPENDAKSRAILQQMKTDEAEHATHALESGGAPLPMPIKKLMTITSKIMTETAVRI